MRLNNSSTEGLLSLDSIPFASCICQLDGKILKANAEFRAFRLFWPKLFKSSLALLITNSGTYEIDNEFFNGTIGIKKISSAELFITLIEKKKSFDSFAELLKAMPHPAGLISSKSGVLIQSNAKLNKLLKLHSFNELLEKFSSLKIEHKSTQEKIIFLDKKVKTETLNLKEGNKERLVKFSFQEILVGNKEYILLSAQDINQETAFQKDIDKLTMIAQSDLVATAILNGHGQLEWCNKTFEKSLGYKIEELINLEPLNILKGPLTASQAIINLKTALKKNKSLNEEICLYTKKNKPIWLRVHLNPIKKRKQSSAGFAFVMREIGEEMKTRNLLKHQLLQNEGILKAIPDLIYRVDGNGYYLSAHAYNQEDLLVPLSKIKGMKFFDMPESQELKEKVWNRIIRAIRTGKVQTIEYERKNIAGKIQSFESRISKSGPNEVVYFVRNITERKEAQEKLEESERKWKAIIENGFDGILLLDKKGIIIDCTSNVTKHFGLNSEHIIGKSVRSFLSKPNRTKVENLLINLLHKNKRKQKQDFNFVTQNGKKIEVEASIVNQLNDKAVQAIVVNYRDITERKTFEAQLLKANNNLKAIINNTKDQIWLINRDFKFIILNQPFIKLVKSKLNETIKEGGYLTDIQHELTRSFWIEKLGKVFSDGRSIRFEETDGQGQTFATTLHPIKTKSGDTTAISVFSVNITEKVEYENKLSKNKKTIDTILKTTSAGIFILDGLNMIYNNAQTRRILGYSTKELRSNTIDYFVHPEDTKGVISRANLRLKGNNKSLHYTIRIIKKNGEIRWLDVHSGTIHYQGTNATIATVLDITNQKIHEEKLIEAKEMAEELTRLKSNFLANMSHEIRTPLNGVLGLAELINMTNSLEEIRDMVQLQKISGQRLLDTLTSILHLSRLEAENNSVHLVKIHLATLLSEIFKVNKLAYDSKGLALCLETINPEYYCLADETMLYQVFNNLLGNALKFTDKGEVRIKNRVYRTKENIEIIEFSVIDSGIGISSEFLPHIFESFRQESQGISRKYEGSGLGLAIAKKYLNLLNGDLSVSSNKGEGSVFYVSIPLKEGK